MKLLGPREVTVPTKIMIYDVTFMSDIDNDVR